MPMSTDITTDRTEDFSRFLCGPLYQFFPRVGLLRPPLDRVIWRVVIIALPLLLLLLTMFSFQELATRLLRIVL